MTTTIPTTTTPDTNLLSPSIANRVAAIAAFLTALAAGVAGCVNVLPKTWQSTVLAGVGVIGAVVTCLHFMLGAQKYDALQAQVQLEKHSAYIAHLETRNQELLLHNELLNYLNKKSPIAEAADGRPDDDGFPPIEHSDSNAFEEAEQDFNPDYTPQYAGHPSGE